jgi:hypothetical protein
VGNIIATWPPDDISAEFKDLASKTLDRIIDFLVEVVSKIKKNSILSFRRYESTRGVFSTELLRLVVHCAFEKGSSGNRHPSSYEDFTWP